MFDFAGFAVRNPAHVTRNARRAWATAKVMKKYRKEHPRCAWCGRNRRVQIHHIVPVSVIPNMADDYDNLITLCAKRCHITLGHSGNYGRRYVRNVKKIWETATTHRVRAR